MKIKVGDIYKPRVGGYVDYKYVKVVKIWNIQYRDRKHPRKEIRLAFFNYPWKNRSYEMYQTRSPYKLNTYFVKLSKLERTLVGL